MPTKETADERFARREAVRMLTRLSSELPSPEQLHKDAGEVAVASMVVKLRQALTDEASVEAINAAVTKY